MPYALSPVLYASLDRTTPRLTVDSSDAALHHWPRGGSSGPAPGLPAGEMAALGADWRHGSPSQRPVDDTAGKNARSLAAG